MRKTKKDAKRSNVVSYCYVVVTDVGGMVSIDPTIYLSKQSNLDEMQECREFPHVFAAKNFIQSHVLPGTFIAVAA
jgi:hypothetical protein